MRYKSWKQIKKADYDQVKELIRLKIKVGRIVMLTGRTYSTIRRIGKSQSWSTYHTPFVPKETPPKTNGVSLHNPDKQDYTLAFLERIATALEKMETHWGQTGSWTTHSSGAHSSGTSSV